MYVFYPKGRNYVWFFTLSEDSESPFTSKPSSFLLVLVLILDFSVFLTMYNASDRRTAITNKENTITNFFWNMLFFIKSSNLISKFVEDLFCKYYLKVDGGIKKKHYIDSKWYTLRQNLRTDDEASFAHAQFSDFVK